MWAPPVSDVMVSLKPLTDRVNVKRKTVLIVALVLLLSVGTAVAVTIITIDPNTIAPGEGTLSGSADLTLDSQSLTYTGNNVTGTDVAVNNTGTSDHEADVHYALRNTTSDTVVESGTVSAPTLTAGNVTTVSITFTDEHSVDTFDKLEINVEQTA